MNKKYKIEEYLESIGGLKNGFFYYREPITSRYFFSCDDGWLDLIQELIEKLIDVGWNKEVTQVKEKYGGLCFYINEGTDEIFKLIEEYSVKSRSVCEICGEEGKNINNKGWYKTVCEKHKNWNSL